MFEKFNEDRGQVGIGTLIVFIAMVLVAAIAAGVLVNTAGFLQATAEDAGQESVDKVTNRLDVLSVHGFVNETSGSDNAIDQLNLTVRLAAGSASVDMSDVTIKYLSESKATTLTNASATGGSEFITLKVSDNDDSFGVLNSPADRFEIGINTSQIEGGSANGLSTGEGVKLEITSRNGGTTQVILSMPQQLAGKNDGDPVSL